MKILIADDHALYRKGIRDLMRRLDAGPVEVLETGDWQTTLALLAQHPDSALVLVDLHMPGMESFEGLRLVLDCVEAVPVVVITASESPLDMKRALDAGAMGYIAKTETPEVMVNALRLVLSGGVYVPPKLVRSSSPSVAARANGLPYGLTPRQYEVLQRLAQGASNKEIGRALGMAERTVKIHVSAVLRALGVTNRQQVAQALDRRVKGPRK